MSGAMWPAATSRAESQIKTLLRDQYLVDAKPLTKVSGHPFRIAEIEAAIDAALP